jgi:hypothetical protein
MLPISSVHVKQVAAESQSRPRHVEAAAADAAAAAAVAPVLDTASVATDLKASNEPADVAVPADKVPAPSAAATAEARSSTSRISTRHHKHHKRSALSLQQQQQDAVVRAGTAELIAVLPADQQAAFEELRSFAAGDATSTNSCSSSSSDDSLSADEKAALAFTFMCGDFDGMVLSHLRSSKVNLQMYKIKLIVLSLTLQSTACSNSSNSPCSNKLLLTQ